MVPSRMRIHPILLMPVVLAGLVFSGDRSAAALSPWVSDQGDGTYRNPVLHADYSDPDAVRVGDDYWMTSSSFSHVPGLPILHSRDLVNWTLVTHALPRLVPEDAFRTPQHGKGVWAPAIRHHAGRFWIYYPDPDHGIYLVTATNPRGPWSEPVQVKGGRGLIDPCPLWDEDGRVYLIHGWARSRSGVANALTLLELSADGTKVIDDFGYVIRGDKLPGYTTLEGPKFLKRDGWYYVLAPAGGVKTGWQSVFRSRDIRGPYEDRIVLAQGSTAINGPHQGALVDTPAGEWWFVHFQDKDAYGRIVHLQPVAWKDGWPLMGTGAATGEVKGEPVLVHRKPALPVQPVAVPPTSDEFSDEKPGLQWQWQANPEQSWRSLGARPGHLRLFSQPEPRPGSLYDASHLLLQKFPALEFTVTTRIEFAPRLEGERAGLIVFGYDYAWLGVANVGGRVRVVHEVVKDAASGRAGDGGAELAAGSGPVWLRVDVRSGAVCRFSYSLDGASFTEVPGEFTARPGRWVGAKVGLFASGPKTGASFAGGHADFDFFRVE